MDDWFTLERIDEDTDILSEYRHWEETHCYLLRGRERSLLIDTGLGICDIRQAVDRLTDRPVAAVATHIHWDHIGGHRYFPEFYAHEAELNWLSGGFPLSVEAVRAMVADRCCLPEDFDVSRYTLFQGHPARVLRDGDRIELEYKTVEGSNGKKQSTNELDLSGLSEVIGLYTCENPDGLIPVGKNLYGTGAVSGEWVPIDDMDENEEGSRLLSGTLELSSTYVPTEMINLLQAQRAFQLNSRIVSAADQMEEMINNLR